MPKRRTYPDKDVTLESGAVVHWTELADGEVPVTCDLCNVKRPVRAQHVIDRLKAGKFFGRHRRCQTAQLSKKKAKSGTDAHPTGATVFWTWEDRDPEDPAHRVAILCSNKEKCVTPSVRAFINRKSVEDPNWSGRCSACVERDGIPQRRTDPGEEVTLRSGSIIHWSERTSRKVPVTCGHKLAGKICGRKRKVSTSHTLAALVAMREGRTPDFTGYCVGHVWEEVKVARAAAFAGLPAAVGGQPKSLTQQILIEQVEELQHKATSPSAPAGKRNGVERKGGRPPKFRDADGLAAVSVLGSRLSISQIAKALGCSRPTIHDWVRRMGFSTLQELAEAHSGEGRGV